MTDGDWHFCPFADDGKGGGCIILVQLGQPHNGPHEVYESEDDD